MSCFFQKTQYLLEETNTFLGGAITPEGKKEIATCLIEKLFYNITMGNCVPGEGFSHGWDIVSAIHGNEVWTNA